ncbi:hypothetical protein SEA_REINDEER_77 [Mycobacterium phage Reindeer]|uniref:Uncharacterized protein n=1 Tax=Mycobacterium phage Reindeer TaxID=2762283 RepID=A0A7G8LI15_9CAUD|nr:hypothetical protein J4U05_gp077 [Mycobacterium phage Reindeer]QNJ56887.1 hypothetical protein SEA_REINDEER_77 [Mycobacterium phage Reindeer]
MSDLINAVDADDASFPVGTVLVEKHHSLPATMLRTHVSRTADGRIEPDRGNVWMAIHSDASFLFYSSLEEFVQVQGGPGLFQEVFRP